METFKARVDRQIAELKAVPLAQGADEILYPGEREARNDIASRRERLTLPDDTRADLRRVAERYAIQTALPFD